MRTNIVLDDSLIAKALKLTGAASKKEVVNLALLRLVESYQEKSLSKKRFIETYIDKPIKVDRFAPLTREEIYDR